ncbi:MAG: cell division protein FtsZ [Candidatus Doudnabacteria bacterium CG10_big_fil_rev_8_21_14_0_10_41_10]|uniref:Cell division protein FtsZ n=1 Tax=Candidatus Doudnabacteria bacterium CG10_big_fil_rev_8_21_14_0_10_41_10 TaxID=1974551 RepID=A0A2H0VCF1_9BACT|nr:MAG: cell division protein FtsZ [Candidatus Doudnabacteria bacterium CG10_big_fil_rev_8_21_14_0_10_41_10]
MRITPKTQTFARIRVLGVGGSGHNAIHRMMQLGIDKVEFIAVNTDAQALGYSKADRKVHIGRRTTRGLGAGMNPEVGRASAEETKEEIQEVVKKSDMIFITCGLGGGTGSGASPVIAEIARKAGILTVAVVTRPFSFEGARRREIAEKAYEELKNKVDTIITIPNDRVLQIIDKKTPLLQAFRKVDDVLHQGVAGIAELVTVPGLINLDFADIKAVMEQAGSALMGIGVGKGETRAIDAARAAIGSPLLETSIDGAKGVLFNVTGGKSLSMYEVDEAAKYITKSVDPDAKIIFGAVIDEKMEDEVKITVVATGFGEGSRRKPVDSVAPVMSMEEKKEEQVSVTRKPMFSTKSLEEPAKQDEQDELDIPAFIRKKMK